MRCALHLPPEGASRIQLLQGFHQSVCLSVCPAHPSGSWSGAERARRVVTELWRSLQVKLMTTWPFTAISSLLLPLVSSRCWSEGGGARCSSRGGGGGGARWVNRQSSHPVSFSLSTSCGLRRTHPRNPALLSPLLLLRAFQTLITTASSDVRYLRCQFVAQCI